VWASFAVMAAASFTEAFRLHNRRLERRIYWCGWLVGAAGIAYAGHWREGWRVSVVAFVVLVLCAVMFAIRWTPYLKVGDRIIATSPRHRQPDPTGADPAPDATRPARTLTADDVRTTSFRKPVGRRGYDPEQVNALLERIAARLDGHGDLTAEDIRTATFSRPRPFIRGYDPDHVDQFLDDAITTLSADTR